MLHFTQAHQNWTILDCNWTLSLVSIYLSIKPSTNPAVIYQHLPWFFFTFLHQVVEGGGRGQSVYFIPWAILSARYKANVKFFFWRKADTFPREAEIQLWLMQGFFRVFLNNQDQCLPTWTVVHYIKPPAAVWDSCRSHICLLLSLFFLSCYREKLNLTNKQR